MVGVVAVLIAMGWLTATVADGSRVTRASVPRSDTAGHSLARGYANFTPRARALLPARSTVRRVVAVHRRTSAPVSEAESGGQRDACQSTSLRNPELVSLWVRHERPPIEARTSYP